MFFCVVCILSNICSGVAVQVNGWLFSFHESMNWWIFRSSDDTDVKVPRRMDCLVMTPNQISTWLSQDPPTGVKWNVMFVCWVSHFLISGVECVA